MKKLIVGATLALAAPLCAAADIDDIARLLDEDNPQEMFRLLSEDLGAALSYKAIAPAEPLGLTGFDVGAEITATSLANSEVFDIVSDTGLSTLPLGKVHVHKGLPFGIDVGAFVASAGSVKLTGVELKYALLEGGVAMPAVAIRGTYTTLDGVDDLELTTQGLELSISKGFLMATPYAGIGTVQVTSTPDVAGLKEEEFSLSKYFVGLNFNLGLMNFAFEADQTGEASTGSFKFGFRF